MMTFTVLRWVPITLAAALLAISSAAFSEERAYGEVDLTGLARTTDWPLNPPGQSYAMVCNVSGPDGFLSIRAGPSPNHRAVRNLKRLAIVEVDTRERRGNWIKVDGAHRNHTPDGRRQSFRDLPVQGWAHDGYLCAFLD